MVSTSASSVSQAPEPIFLLHAIDRHGDLGRIEESLVNFGGTRFHCALQDFEVRPPLTQTGVSQVLSELMTAGAYAGSGIGLGMPTRGHLDLLMALMEEGIVEHSGDLVDARWSLTWRGRSQMSSVAELHEPTPVFAVRDHLPLEDNTSYELNKLLDADGWVWKRWVPKSARRKNTEPIPIGYENGSPKAYYTTKEVSPAYLRCLLRSNTHFAAGLLRVPHAMAEICYSDILKGDYRKANGAGAVQAVHCLMDVEEAADATEGEEEAPAVEAVDGAVGDGDDDEDGEIDNALLAALGEALEEPPEHDEQESAHDPFDEMDWDLVDDGFIVAPPPLPPPVAPAITLADVVVNDCYGVFRLTCKPEQGPYGSVQITCPLHKLSHATGCKKTKQVSGPTPELLDECMIWLCCWVSRWQHSDRQQKHMKDDKFSSADIPSLSVLNTLKPMVKPDAKTVCTDAELDARDAVLS